jgi:hypothetical protein
MNNTAGNNSTKNVGKNAGNARNTGNNANANKPAGNNANATGNANANKPAGNNANANKPAGNNANATGNANANKPAGNNANANKPAGNNANSNANKPAGNNATGNANANKPAGNNANANNPAGNNANGNKPAGNNANGNANANKPAGNNANSNGNANANKPAGNKFGDMLSENTLDDLKSSLSDATDKIGEQTNILKSNLGDDLYDKIKIGLIIVIVLVIVGVIGYFLYKKFRSKYTESKSVYFLENISTSDPNVIPDCELTKPKDGFNYSIHLTLYIDNYYNNYGTWRHIFHKGTPIEKGRVLDYRWYDETNDSWDEVLADMPRQAPGLWLHPNQNTLRFVLETEYEKEHCPLEHANPKTSLRLSSRKPIEFNSPKSQIQFMDIPDIPVQTPVSLTFLINSNNVTIYYNGKMRNIYTFKGKPVMNRGPLYFHAPKSYGGELKDFYFFPIKISEEKIKQLTTKS